MTPGIYIFHNVYRVESTTTLYECARAPLLKGTKSYWAFLLSHSLSLSHSILMGVFDIVVCVCVGGGEGLDEWRHAIIAVGKPRFGWGSCRGSREEEK